MRYARMETPAPWLRHTRTTCDLCAKDVNARYGDVEIEAREGDLFGDEDDRIVESADVCYPCWKATVRPALEAIGIKFRERRADDFSHDDYLREDLVTPLPGETKETK